MKRPQIKLAQHVIEACKAKQIKHIVISPGSRNAPLTIGFANNPYFSCYSIVDERCAAFFALGIAQQRREPVAVVCTSGSALLNYYPAFSEAFYSNIPLVVISADRPSSKIDIGDGQTIRQVNVLANHSAYNANLSDETHSDKSNFYELNRALNTAIEEQLPVHINVPFEEPLYLTTEEQYPFENIVAEIKNPIINKDKATNFVKHWNSSAKKMVLVGVLTPNSVESQYVEWLAKDPSVVVLTETTSNLHHSHFIPYIDKLLTYTEKDPTLKESLHPDLLLTFGGLVVSKKIKQFLRSYQPTYHYNVDLHKDYNSYFCLTAHFKADINTFLREVTPNLINVSSTYQQQWLEIKNEIQQIHLEYINQIPFSDFKVYNEVFNNIPNDHIVQISNSSAIRYAQLMKAHPSWKVFCNRGTSGIDGSMSTAIGAAVGSASPTVFITGDLSFFYDSNALWNKYIPQNFRVILLNNQGGGIFRILPGDKTDSNFEYFFETPHKLTAEHFCKMYNINYQSATNLTDLQRKIGEFYEKSDVPKLLEVHTPRKINDKVLLKYFEFIKK
ncbi:2-succinyl-5-enolpyruvyl-6-hydroxy-3-cyclohexene-1-carboxylic-acid synthase [Capnocytophaga sputigena]|uniref:2-succinyl-5-enolpyruvyl-6-hydroxy-3-cyclohexene-1-carboxylate synthase n=1 Tax=Capnocytophaga sputigena TaxID=1019 RepID=A0AAX2IEX9_CAPSP|nr:2-succinyl-5-enolpyruvyl-6-hydroxy-3-cyclohexene-1-carboxylic-acid synthase [Capnocytophaga sputigena]ATA85547.1 2-succinyl-5-enolpyruvyl-6-hydroxy-3-cyclohexene-1-carboxylate synthase [Capnocytophaga sputigena]EEB66124.1 2-succinyl-5-enolpyruvyl-6-hydroxy-3-cyclohexene-1-carboxylic-acid synthase [Capnocytophaga sputigena ATCC 33612]SQA76712.1 2-succinyl-5-enolpyruvyl-6-hydroxy-3-cyclohexene-1-carboxylate synthase [Capnocytophaga sputigena]